MSYSFDVMAQAWANLREHLPEEVKHGELAMRFGFMIEDVHEANHLLRDGINHNPSVTRCARKLDALMNTQPPEEKGTAP